MASTEVAITADPTWARQPGVQRLLVLLVNIVARCFGTITVHVSSDIPLVVSPAVVSSREKLVDALRDLVAVIRGPEFAPGPPWHHIRLHVGPKPPKRATVSVAADGWRALLWGGNAAQEKFTGDPNAGGAYLAALLGATAVVRAFIEEVTTSSRTLARDDDLLLVDAKLRERYGSPLGTVVLNAWDLFGLDDGPVWRARDLGRIVLSSIGAVNGAVLVMVALAGDLTADIDGYEPQMLVRSNLRYLYALACQMRKTKARAAEAIAGGAVTVRGHSAPVTSDLGRFAEDAVVVSGADNDTARHATQRLTRGPLVSLATELDQIHVSTHGRDLGPCLGCVFPGDAIGGGAMPTHPLVGGWAGFLGLMALLQGSGRPLGLELRFSALRPAERCVSAVAVRPNCPVCGGRRTVAESTPAQ